MPSAGEVPAEDPCVHIYIDDVFVISHSLAEAIEILLEIIELIIYLNSESLPIDVEDLFVNWLFHHL